MSETKWTKSPWKAVSSPMPLNSNAFGVLAVNPMRGRIDSTLQGMCEADARLIAAAPELYEACKYIEDHIGDPERTIRDLYPAFGLDSSRALEMVRNALRKAEGR